MADRKQKAPRGAGGKRTGSRKKSTTKEQQKEGQSLTESFPIVCLGASAGGLKSLEDFLSNATDKGGMAFVVISHTDPDRASPLPGILQRKSKIAVKTIEDGMIPERNEVYLPPSNKDLVIDKGKFHLQDREQPGELHMPIALFLESLAKAREEFAGCVILSGTGSDGTHGLRLIKEAGRISIAESRTSASHYEMPQSAIETGMVDFILEPAQMPRQLMEYFEHRVRLEDTVEMPREEIKEGKEVPKSLSAIIKFLANRTKHDFPQYKKSTLIRRIERRMTVTRSKSAVQYLDYLRRDAGESEALFQELLIGVTEFFRESFDDYKVEHRFPKIGERRVFLNARLLVEDEGQSGRILLAIEDIADRNLPEAERK
jgi:two-component system CheB/CheR fusion protein